MGFLFWKNMRTENLIFSQLIHNEQYVRAVMPHLRSEYFSALGDIEFFKIYTEYFNKHNSAPSVQALRVEIENTKTNAETYKQLQTVLKDTEPFTEKLDFLISKTESFCKERAVFNALKASVLIVDGQDKVRTPESIPSILQSALSICFNTTVGHDYIAEAQLRYEYYHAATARIPTGIGMLDEITKGGFPRKTLNILLAPPHGGKSLVMVNIGAGALRMGSNVLYITAEMAEFEIGRRFDVNLMGIDFATLDSIGAGVFDNKFSSVAAKARGRLIIKEFPTGAAHAGHFRALLEELKTKQNFAPDMIIIDYMGICASEKYKASSGANSYTMMKSVGEELRALAIEYNAAVISAVQTNRGGVGNSDVDMTSISESLGHVMIADWMLAIINTEELKQLKQLCFKQLKNRYKSLDDPNRFILGVDYDKMKLFDLDSSASKYKPKATAQNKKSGDIDFDFEHTIKTPPTGFEDFNF